MPRFGQNVKSNGHPTDVIRDLENVSTRVLPCPTSVFISVICQTPGNRDTVSQSVSYFTVPPQIETRESFPKHVSVQSCTLVIANKPNAMRRQMMRSSRGADPRRHILEPRVDSTRAASKQPMQKREAPLRGGKLEAIERPRLHLHVLRSSGKKTPGGAGTQRHTRDTPGIKRHRGDLPV